MVNRMKRMVLTGAAVTMMMSFATPAMALPYTAGDSPAQTPTDISVAHQPGGFHPFYPSQWPYGQIRPEEGVEA